MEVNFHKIKEWIKLPSLKSVLYNMVLAAVSSVCLALPDVIMNLLGGTHIVWEPLFSFYLFGFMFLLYFCSKWVIVLFWTIIVLMQLVQLNFIAFFGHPITAGEILNIVREHTDVFDPAYLNQTWFVLPSIIICYGLVIYLLAVNYQKMAKMRWLVLVVLYLAAHKPYRAFSETKAIWYFQPGPTRSSLKNSISTFSYFFFQYIWKNNQQNEIEYADYSLSEIPTTQQNVLIIFGESLASNHMPMYGYQRDTMPKLQELVNKHQAQVSQVLSSGIATATTTRLFFNVVREPANLKELRNNTANMFRAAKNHGYKTHYISNQESRLLLSLGEKYIDEIINNDTNPLAFAQSHDAALSDFLREIDLKNDRNFIVLHMRVPHSPYEKHYRPEQARYLPVDKNGDRYTYLTNSYDNALLVVDDVMSDIVSHYLEQTVDQPARLYITADHAQLFNHNGLWGHNNLDMAQSKVAGIVFDTRNKPMFPKVMSQYRLGKEILRDVGYELRNPNEKGNVAYLHGNNIEFPYNYLEYDLDENGEIISVSTHNTAEKK